MAGQENADTPSSPLHPHPRILLVDMQEQEAEGLTDAGYRVERGTFGPLISVGSQPGSLPLPYTADLPHYREQEIVVVDCAIPRASSEHELGEPGHGEKWLWQKAGQGLLDPRPWAMARHRDSLDRIYNHGGVFVCFAAPRFTDTYSYVEEEWELRQEQGQTALSTWGFLSVLNAVQVDHDKGEEILAEPLSEKIPGLKQVLEAGTFTCTMEPGYQLEDRWVPLAKNKYGQTVAALIGPEKDSEQRALFLLPRIAERPQFLQRLVDETLPRFAPKLFPHVQQGEWTKQPPYELPGVAEIRTEMEQVQEEAKAKVAELEGKIEERREEHGFLHELLTEDDDRLVAAVKRTLELLGFQDVRDVDEEAENKKALREDLQVWDRESLLICEVKGIGGPPREADALQVTKYIAPRMKETGQPAQGLTIVNHQLRVEGLQRQKDNVFQSDVVTSAESYHVGLLTTWNLFRLARAYLRYGWRPEQVADLFYKYGVIEPIPTHYELVGTVNQFFEQASALTIDLSDEIRVGDTLAFELPVEFEQERVQSLRLNDEAAEQAGPDVEIGVKTSLTKQQARKGVRVFKVT